MNQIPRLGEVVFWEIHIFKNDFFHQEQWTRGEKAVGGGGPCASSYQTWSLHSADVLACTWAVAGVHCGPEWSTWGASGSASSPQTGSEDLVSLKSACASGASSYESDREINVHVRVKKERTGGREKNGRKTWDEKRKGERGTEEQKVEKAARRNRGTTNRTEATLVKSLPACLPARLPARLPVCCCCCCGIVGVGCCFIVSAFLYEVMCCCCCCCCYCYFLPSAVSICCYIRLFVSFYLSAGFSKIFQMTICLKLSSICLYSYHLNTPTSDTHFYCLSTCLSVHLLFYLSVCLCFVL